MRLARQAWKYSIALILSAGLAGVAVLPQADAEALAREVAAAMNTISGTRIKIHLRFLSSDLLEGRGTGSRGSDLAAEYIATTLQLSALWPGAPGSSYKQRVPLVGVETLPESDLTFQEAGPGPLEYKRDYVLWTDTQQERVESEGDLIFVGYGIEAPEFSWDDYKGVDVSGKVLLMLVNDPPSEDTEFFGGKALTYYGRWTYKFEAAAARGAIGALLVHTDESAGYGWEVVRNSWTGERSYNELDPAAPTPLRQAGWITERASRQLLQALGQDLDALVSAAARPDFRPVPLGISSRARVISKIRRFDSYNVIGVVPGTDDNLKDEAVIVTAHYDHLGIGEPDESGDAIYNGAYDNASGVATMLELARAFRLGTVKPLRTVVFMAVTAEEQGLRGSEYYVQHPTFPPGKIAASFNLDGVSVLGVTEDMVFLGGARSSLEGYIDDAARLFGFAVSPDAHPEQGSFYRSDHFPFARIGVPSVSIEHGTRFAGRDPGWGEQQFQEFNDTRYHRPSDEFQADWDLDGAEKTAKIAFYLAYRVANAPALPVWNEGDEFAAARKEALDAVGGASR